MPLHQHQSRGLIFRVTQNDNGTLVASVTRDESNPHKQDDVGALYYVVAVIFIYGCSILMMIASYIRKNKMDRRLQRYLKVRYDTTDMANVRKRQQQILLNAVAAKAAAGLESRRTSLHTRYSSGYATQIDPLERVDEDETGSSMPASPSPSPNRYTSSSLSEPHSNSRILTIPESEAEVTGVEPRGSCSTMNVFDFSGVGSDAGISDVESDPLLPSTDGVGTSNHGTTLDWQQIKDGPDSTIEDEVTERATTHIDVVEVETFSKSGEHKVEINQGKDGEDVDDSGGRGGVGLHCSTEPELVAGTKWGVILTSSSPDDLSGCLQVVSTV